MAEKYCPYCEQTLDASAFTKDRKNKDGLRARCRECYNSYLKERRGSWPSRSPEAKTLEWQRYIEKHNGDPTKKERDARYRANNSDKTRARALAWYRHPVSEDCTIEGCHKAGERHHLSYDDPDDFIWLCKEHHQAQHQGQGGAT